MGFYYVHLGSGRTQLGFPCAGELEDLPPGWEKCAPRKGGAPYYFNRSTGSTRRSNPSDDKALDLPLGWERLTSRTGEHYFFHMATNKSQEHRPLPPGWEASSRGAPERSTIIMNPQ